jgi:hypothetical protein
LTVCAPVSDGVRSADPAAGPVSVIGSVADGPAQDQYSPAQRTGPGSASETVLDW